MVLARGLFLLAIYGISCCYSLRLHQLAFGLQDAYGRSRPQAQPGDDKSMDAKNFEQKVDHFNEDETRTWTQRYYEEDKYYEKGGPVYLWIEGADFHHPFRLKVGYWVNHAKKNKAALFAIGHRFHDMAQPLQNTSTDNLAYLTVPQTLSDYAAFIEGMNELNSYPKNTKWILFGASYGGTLAAWMRFKYPNLVHGAVASSAPVLAQMEIPEYLSNVGSSIESYNKKCKTDIALANQKIDELATTKNGRKEIGEIFKLCDPLHDNTLSTSVFVDDMATYISEDVQHDLEKKQIKKMCDKMMENADTKKPIQRYAQLMEKYMSDHDIKCLKSNFDAEIDLLKEDDPFSSLVSGRSWYYQLCTEFGWFRISGKKNHIFSKNINSELYFQICSKAFKPSFNKKFISQAVEKTNKSFGGLKLNTQRTLFVHGPNDPWRNFGITSTKNNKNVDVVTVKGGSHASDIIHYGSKTKNKNVEAAVKQILAKLDSWLKK